MSLREWDVWEVEGGQWVWVGGNGGLGAGPRGV